MTPLNERAVVELVEAVYDQEGDDGSWKSRLSEATFPLVGHVDGLGLVQYRWNRDGAGAFRITDVMDIRKYGTAIRWDKAVLTRVYTELLPPILGERTLGRTVAQASTAIDSGAMETATFRATWKAPVVDALGLVACETDGNGLCLALGSRTRLAFTPRGQSTLNRVAYHLAAGFRLRIAGAVSTDNAEAILSTRGKWLHAKGRAWGSREALDEGRRRRDEARKTKHDATLALDIWRGLVAGRWSLIDHFDTDGKRFLLAMKNAPKVDRIANLTPRERRVCALAAMGHRDKEIAYLLGLSMPAVTGALHSARAKLGVRSRTELAGVWRGGSYTAAQK